MKQRYLQVITDGGAGDMIAELVAVDYNIRSNKQFIFQTWVQDYMLSISRHLLPRGSEVLPFSKAPKLFDPKTPGKTTEWVKNGPTPMRIHPVDYGFHVLADRHEYDLSKKNYLQIRTKEINIQQLKLPEKYVCIGTTAAEPCKAMPSNVLNEIIDHVSSKGLTPVFLGKEKSECGFKDFVATSRVIEANHSKGINLINKTDLLEAAAVIAGAKCFIGMDSGLVHLSGCTDTNIVAGYSLASPIHLAPIRKGSQTYKFWAVEPDENIPNRYFQTNANMYHKDYRQFPGWRKVIENLTADKWIKNIDLALSDQSTT